MGFLVAGGTISLEEALDISPARIRQPRKSTIDCRLGGGVTVILYQTRVSFEIG